MLKYNVLDICVHQLYGVPVYAGNDASDAEDHSKKQ